MLYFILLLLQLIKLLLLLQFFILLLGLNFLLQNMHGSKNVPLEEIAGVSCAGVTSYCDVFC